MQHGLLTSPNTKVSKAHLSQRGLTLVEIMVVLIILTVLGVFLLSKVAGGGDQAKARITKLSIGRIAQEIEVFRLEYNGLPQSMDEIVKGSDRLGADYIPLLNEDDAKDAWGNPFQYELIEGGGRYRITSFGADGKAGGAGVDFDVFGTGP